jgi:acyl transferase domain-containing protein/NAD(P)-dependent dehydrogenase (short-subunit alcohol dehydrogenase family)/phosphopantetheinyl transferase/acyl carrier protein
MMNDAIAIIGMGCIFPDANNPREYWKNIINRHCSIREIPNELWDPSLYYDPVRKLYKTYSKIGAYIKGFEKNPVKFRIPPVSAPFIERTQFLMLEVVHQALEDAGYLKKNFPREQTAVFVGFGSRTDLAAGHNVRANWSHFAKSLKSVKEFTQLPQDLKDYILGESEKIFNQGMPELSEDSCAGVFSSIVASRICNCFDLGGISLTIDAACASSLAAVDLGVRGLRERNFDLVLAGAVDDNLSALSYLLFSSLGALSAKGSFPFDERADGMVLGQGAGVILLKRLDDAVRDGDKIYAVIRSIGTSSDGRVKGITAPNMNGQIRALERTYSNVPFTPEVVSLIEAHGTGTWLGDITEIKALTKFVHSYSDKKRFIGIGSVKSMIGHLKSAAGMAGIIKVVLALYNRILPPTINCEQPRKDVDWENSPFYLITESRPWQDGFLPRRAGVDAFGFGGINFHAILEEAPSKEALLSGVVSVSKEDAEFPAELFVFRAPTRKKLLGLIENTKDELIRAGQDDLQKIAIHLTETVSSAGPILAIVADGTQELKTRLDKALKVLNDESRSEFSAAQGIYFSETSLRPGEKIAFLFPGFGSQYLNMGGDLPDYFPFVGEIFHKVDSIAQQRIGASILTVLSFREETSKEERSRLEDLLMRPDYNHPAMMALGMGILEVLGRAGVRPDMVAGHSLGEYIALYAAGVFDMQTAIDVIIARGKGIAAHCFQNGAMASIGTSVETLHDILKEAPGFVAVANKNCPAQTVISGDIQAVDYVLAHFKNVPCRRLAVACASHTQLLASCAEAFRKFLDHITINPPKIPVQSNLTGRAYKSDEHFASYLCDSLPKHLIQPVEFINNILSLYEDGARLFVEVGAGTTLSSFVDNILVDKPHWTVATNLMHRSATLQVLHALVFCISRGLPVNLNGVMPTQRRQALLRTAPVEIAKPPPFPITTESKSPGKPDLIRDALADKDVKKVEDYLKQRGNFLKDMLRADFKHFTETVIAQAGERIPEADDLEKRIVDLISHKTGYPPEVIDIDLDVEAELGLDSIKQVEIIRAVAQELDINFGEDLKSQRFKMTTPRKLIEACRDIIAQKSPIKQREPLMKESKDQMPKKDWRTDCYRWVSENVEAPLSGERSPEALKGRHVLLLAGEEGPGDLLKGCLEQAGAVVSAFKPTHSLESLPDDFNLVLNLSSYGEDETPTLEKAQDWWKQTSQRAEVILRVAKKLVHFLQRNKNNRALWVEVTSLGGELGAHAIERVSAAAGIGLGVSRCLAREFPDMLETFYLDFTPQEPHAQVAQCVFNELIHHRSHPEIGYMQGKRFEICWKIDALSNQERDFPLNNHSVVLAIGGARGVTASICRGIAERSQAQFIIVGRSPFSMENDVVSVEPITFDAARNMLLEEARVQNKRIVPAELDRLAWKQVWKTERALNMNYLRSISKKVTYRQCDITDAEKVRRLINEIKQEHDRIDLVIQGASDLIEKSTMDINVGEFTENMKSKALGTACLLAALSEAEVGAFINFSSVAGRWGNMGQGSYAAGHEVAAILVAGMRGKRPGKWVNIFFGPWLNVGMIRIGEVMERLRGRGSDFITEKTGSEFFVKELLCGVSRNVAFCGKKSVRTFRELTKQDKVIQPTPLLDSVETIEPGVVQGRKVFDLKRDRFISEHYIYYDNPTLPGVVSLEMIAQTASLLSHPDFSVTDIEDIVFPHPGIFPREEPREFYARARLLSKEEKGMWFLGEVFSHFNPPGSMNLQEMCHARCRMRFGHRDSPQKPSLLLVSTGIGDCRIDALPLWKTQIRQARHGMFRTIHAFSSITREGVVGEVLAGQSQEFGKWQWLDNPFRLDGLVDLVNLSTDIFLGRESSLVSSIKSIKFFASDDLEGIRFCRTRIREINETSLIYDVEAMDNTGNVAERISGIQKVLVSGEPFSLSEQIWELVKENPRQKEIKRLLGYKDKLVFAQINISLVKDALEADEDGLLHEQLAVEEIKRYRRLTHPKRRLEWLAGRIAAKGAVRIYLDKQAPPTPALKIKGLPNCSPHVDIDTKECVVSLPHISISHSGDIAVASAAQTPGVGIDTEVIAESILEIADEFCTDEELELIMACCGFTKLIALTSIWVIKEASCKAIEPEACLINYAHTSHIKSVAFQSNNCFFAVSVKNAYARDNNR